MRQYPRIRKKLAGPFDRCRCGDAPPAELVAGIDEFNRGLYFEQHETLEELWRSEPDDVRYLYQGILLVGVGLYHLSRGNRVGAKSKLQHGLDLLRWFAPSCQGVDVERLIADGERALEAVDKAGPSGPLAVDRTLYPRIRLSSEASPGSRES